MIAGRWISFDAERITAIAEQISPDPLSKGGIKGIH